MVNSEENKVLVNALKDGDEAAYMQLIDTYSKRLFAYALSLVNNHAHAQDILQNVYLSTWRYRKKLNADHSIKSFLFKSVYNEFINQYRHKKSLKALEEKYVNSLERVVVEGDDNNLMKVMSILNGEIALLPPKCRQIFTMSKKEGLSNIEIAEYLGVSKKTVEGQMTKAFKILKAKLKDKIGPLLFFLIGKLFTKEN